MSDNHYEGEWPKIMLYAHKVGNTITPAKLGHFCFLVGDGSVQRKIIKQEHPTENETVDSNMLQNLLAPDNASQAVLLSMDTVFLPLEIMGTLRAAGLEKDLMASCTQVVICSNVLGEVAKIEGEPVYDACPGFIVEDNPASPYHLPQNDPVATVLMQNFIFSPEKTIFFNYHSLQQASLMAGSLAISVFLIYFLGFLRSEKRLTFGMQKLHDPKRTVAINYHLRAFYAVRYLLNAATKLECRLEEETYSVLYEYAASQFIERFKQLDTAEQKLISSLGM